MCPLRTVEFGQSSRRISSISRDVPFMTMMSAGPILLSLLLLLSIEQRANYGRVESQDPNSSGTNAPAQKLPASDKRIFVATLPNTVDVKKVKAGDTIRAVGTNLAI